MNEIAYQRSLNNLVMGFSQGRNAIATDDPLDMTERTLPVYNHPETIFDHGFTVLDPPNSDPQHNHVHFWFALKEGYWNDIFLDEDDDTNMTNSDFGSYIAFLGHLPTIGGLPIEEGQEYTAPMSMGSNTHFAFEDFDGSADDQINQVLHPTPAFNIDLITPNDDEFQGKYQFTEGGWSMMRGIKQNMVEKCRTIYVTAHPQQNIGAISIGNYSTLSHSPSTGYTFDLLHDGINYKTAKGGASFSSSNYSGPPNWYGGGAAWEVGHKSEFDGIETQWLPSKLKRMGRRSFSLAWEGFADTSILPTNTLNSVYSNTDSDNVLTNPNILDGNTFYNQILIKTLDSSFIFQSDSTTFDPQNFMIGRWASPNMAFSQVSHKIYSFSNSIIESW